MRLLILGAGGPHRTETALLRAAQALGHEAKLLDALRLRRVTRQLAGRVVSWRADRFEPDFILCTRHAISAGEPALARLLRGRPSAFWYFDALSPLPPRVVALARLVERVFSTYTYQVDAFRAVGVAEAHFLPQGVDPLESPAAAVADEEFRCDLSFIGSGQYLRRHPILRAFATVGRLQIRGPNWHAAPADLPVVGGAVRGAPFQRVVQAASISLGIDALETQRQERGGGTSNRLWQVLGAGGFFLTERVGGMERFVVDGAHVVGFGPVEEGVELARHHLRDAAARRRIATAGQAHALAEHTYAHRLARLLGGQGYSST